MNHRSSLKGKFWLIFLLFVCVAIYFRNSWDDESSTPISDVVRSEKSPSFANVAPIHEDILQKLEYLAARGPDESFRLSIDAPYDFDPSIKLEHSVIADVERQYNILKASGAQQASIGRLSWQARIRDDEDCGDACEHIGPYVQESQYRIEIAIRRAGSQGMEGSAFVSPRISEVIRRHESNGILNLNIVPLFVDGRLEPIDANGSAYPLKIRLALEAGRSGPKSQPSKLELSDVAVNFKVKPNASGCAILPVFVWNDNKTKALDNFLVLIPLDDDSFTQERCGPSAMAYRARVRGGKSLFAMDLSAEDGRPQILVHAFEAHLNGGLPVNYLVAVIDQDDNTDQPKIVGWQIPGADLTLGRLFASGGPLAGLLERSREKLSSPDKAIRDSAYQDLANALSEKIFSAPYPGSDAETARILIVDKINSLSFQNSRAGIVLRATSLSDTPQGSQYYFPLGIISESSAIGLTAPFDVISPLPIQSGFGQCIKHWSVILAPQLLPGRDSVAAENLQALRRAPASEWRGKAMTEFSEIRDFLEPKPSQAAVVESSEAEGLIVVAHYAEGRGLFLEEGEPFVSRVTRKFGNGSAALLGACATGAPQSSGGIIRDLNAGNVDAMIVSPLPVNAAFTIRLAHAFEQSLKENYVAGATPTIAEVYASALNKVHASFLSSDPESLRGKQAAEFMILGNSNVRLCKLN